MKTIKEIVLQDKTEKDSEGYATYLNDVLEHGCVSGMVGGLTYYHDTEKFFEDHK